jgi:hypothetical protein
MFALSIGMHHYGDPGIYNSVFRDVSLGTVALNQATIYVEPFAVLNPCRWDQLGYEVTTFGAGSTIDFAVYEDDNMFPGRLLKFLGVGDASSNAVKTLDVQIALEPLKLYWLGYRANTNNASFRSALPGMFYAGTPTASDALSATNHPSYYATTGAVALSSFSWLGRARGIAGSNGQHPRVIARLS